MSPKPIQYVKGDTSTHHFGETSPKKGCNSVKQARPVQQRPVIERIKHLNPETSLQEADPKFNQKGDKMIANGRAAMEMGGSKQIVRGEGFPQQPSGHSLKRRNNQDTRHHQNLPPMDDRKRQRNAQWTIQGPPANGSPKMPKQTSHVLHDPEVQVVDPKSPSEPSGEAYGRGAHESAHPGPSRRPQQDQKLRSGVMVSRVAPHGSRYNTEQLSAVHEALSQAEEALLEAKNQAQEHMRELPLRLKAFFQEQLSSMATACGFTVQFSTPPDGAGAAGAISATFLPNSAGSKHAKEPEPVPETNQPSPRRTKVQVQATGGNGVRSAVQEPAPARQAQPPPAASSADVAAVAQAMMPAIMSRVSVPPHVQGNQGSVRSSLRDRLEHETAAPVCFRFTKDESRETPERGGETPSEGTDMLDDDPGHGEESQAVARQTSAGRSSGQRGPPRWNPNDAPEHKFGPGRGGDRLPPSGGRSGAGARGPKPQDSDMHMQGGKYSSGRGSPPPPMSGRHPGRGRDRGYGSAPLPNDAWDEPPHPNRGGARNRSGGGPRRQDGPTGRGGRGGRGRDHGGRGPPGGHPMDGGGEGFRGDGGRGRGRGRGQYSDFR